MNFEQLSNEYLVTLVTTGVFVTGALVGVNEVLQTSNAKVGFMINNEVSEKFIIIYKENGNLTWKFYNQADNVLLYDYSTSDWNYPTFSKRIVAPISLSLQYPQFEIWFRLNNLPIVTKNGNTYCYCNQILPEHQALADSLQGQITIENRP